MSYARQMLDSYRRSFNIEAGLLAATIDALNDCAQACTADADADLGEQHVSHTDQVHPALLGLRGCVCRHRSDHKSPGRVRLQDYKAAP